MKLKHLPLLCLLLFSLVPLIWFYRHPGTIINGSDTNFPLNISAWFTRRSFVWQSITNAGSDFSSSTAGTFFHFIQFLPSFLGLNLHAVQITSLLFWFALLVFSAFVLARAVLPGKPAAQLVFMVLYVFNIYLFNTWENVKVTNLSLVTALPLAVSILILLQKKSLSLPHGLFYSALVGLILSGTGINPAYLIVFFGVLLIYLLSNLLTRPNRFSQIINFFAVSACVILVNSFWILPSSSFIFSTITPFSSLDKLGFINWTDSLSVHTSFLNTMRMQGAWDWYSVEYPANQPTYIPYAPNYFYRLPFLAFSFLLPALALISLIWRDKEHQNSYLFFAFLLVVGIFMGSGTHSPTGVIFNWLLVKIPFFSLFRSPWYIFTPMVTLAYAGLVGLLFSRRSFWLAALILVIGNLVYTYPLVTGKIFRPTQPDNFLIKFPSYVFSAQKWLSESKFQGRFLSYPPDEIERFTWGYNGIDSILSLLSSAEVIFPSLNATSYPISPIIQEIYHHLRNRQLEAAENLSAKLNIGQIFNKLDQKTLAPPLSQDVLNEKLISFGPWEFYRFPPTGQFVSKIFSPSQAFRGWPYPESSKLLSILPGLSALVNPADSQVNSIPTSLLPAGQLVLASNSQEEDIRSFTLSKNPQSKRLQSRELSTVTFTFSIPEQGPYEPLLERHNLENFGLLKDSLPINLDGVNVTWKIQDMTDSYVRFAPVTFSTGQHKVTILVETPDHISGGDFEQGSTFQKISEAKFDISSAGQNHFLAIDNKGFSAPDPSARFRLADFDPSSTYLITFKYKWAFGNVPQLVVDQTTGRVSFKTVVETLPKATEWQDYSYYFTPFDSVSQLDINLITPFISDPLGTKVFYDDLHAYEVFSQNLFFIKAAPDLKTATDITFDQKSSVSYTGTAGGAQGPHVLVFSENYSPAWSLHLFDTNHKPSPVKPLHFSANSYANAWYIPLTGKYHFEIYYTPQNLRQLGVVISLATLSFTVFLLCLKK